MQHPHVPNVSIIFELDDPKPKLTTLSWSHLSGIVMARDLTVESRPKSQHLRWRKTGFSFVAA